MTVKATDQETPDKKIKVLIVDDAAFMRSAIFKMIEGDAHIEVVGTACNGQEALEKIDQLKPDVITLDIDMPVMDGISCTRHIMIESPVPVVILSSLFNDGEITFDALRLGVVDFIPKPSGAVSTDIDRSQQHLIDRIKLANSVNISNIRRVRLPQADNNKNLDHYGYQPLDFILTLGTTLSGPNAIIRLLANLPPTLPTAIVVILEISPKIIDAFIERFDKSVPWEIYKAEDGMQVKQGVCYVSPYQEGISIQSKSDGTVFLAREEQVKEPLNQLFISAADVFQENTVGILLSGVGTDGAEGFSHIKKLSGTTMAQDTQTCVFPNLTDNAIKQGTVNSVLNESALAQAVISIMTE